ncbi:MAG: hypothetical protein ACI857_002486, partial [Arenicella sp.]
FSQLDQGKLILEEHPPSITKLIENDRINLIEVRRLTNFLTNIDIVIHDFLPISKRKKAFVRHIKHLSEKLEWAYFNDKKVGPTEFEILYELVLFEKSMKENAFLNALDPKSFSIKVSMYKSVKRSKRVFKYNKADSTNIIVSSVYPSPFWVKSEVKNRNFNKIAKLKKIKSKKRMVVLFKGLSYSGSAPKIKGLDLDYDNEWSVKWGDEVHTDVFGSRVFASMGYDVDHPYFYGKDKMTLVFDGSRSVKNAEQLVDSVFEIFQVDLLPFITSNGLVTDSMARDHKKLSPFIGMEYVRFYKCALEGRPDRVKRIGPIMCNDQINSERTELKGALLLHAFIGNWDTRIENTCLTTVHDGNHNYRMSATFSDLGTSMGVKMTSFPPDFKVGLVNELDWEVFKIKEDKIKMKHEINSILTPYENAGYNDLKWMAQKIEKIDSIELQKMIDEASWPEPIAILFFQKMASRRANILVAFDIEDTHAISFSKELNLFEDGEIIVSEGKLIEDYNRDENPESFLSKKGRTRNYGN